MARWTLKCENCGFPFTHSQIDDSSAPNFFLPESQTFLRAVLSLSVLIADMNLRTSAQTSCIRLRRRTGVSFRRTERFSTHCPKFRTWFSTVPAFSTCRSLNNAERARIVPTGCDKSHSDYGPARPGWGFHLRVG
jgi:hypothetical protein